MSTSTYRANFLFPHDDHSLEEAGYEFANGKNEIYLEHWWDILVERAGDLALKKLSTAKLAEILSKREGVERVDVAPHTHREEHANGPCIILKVID